MGTIARVPGSSASRTRARAGRAGLSTLLVASALGALFATAPAAARSRLAVSAPLRFGEFDAITYAEDGRPIGHAHLSISKDPDGRVRMTSRTAIDGGARNEANAEFTVGGDGRTLRLIAQHIESFDEEGASRGAIVIDHERGTGRCERNRTGDSATIALPESDRVANAVLNLLFAPIARDGLERLEFQLFLCRGGPRIIDFAASMAPRVDAGGDHRVVDIEYRPDLGPLLRWLPDAVLPELHFWLDADGNYLAHRIPLYTEGPEVLVIRSDLSPASLAPRSGD